MGRRDSAINRLRVTEFETGQCSSIEKEYRMLEFVLKIANALWCHRAVYVGLACAYGALCMGADKELVNQCVTGFYAALAMQRAH